MRIVDVCAFYTPRGGGVRTYVEQKMSIGPSLGHEIIILAPGEEHSVVERGDGARIVTIPGPKLLVDRKYHYFSDEAALHRTLDELAPDFVEVSSPWSSPSMVARWQGAAPRSLVMHADPLAAYAYRWFGAFLSRPAIDRLSGQFWTHLRTLSRQYDRTVCACNDLSRRMRDGGLERVATIPMGVETGVFSPTKRDEALRASLLAECDLPPSANLLLAVGRLAPEKRMPMVIEAVTAASREFPIGLVVLGEGRDKRNVLSAIGGNPHIRLFEPVRQRDRFAAMLASADGMVHGGEAETFCMAAAEARASGTPVIVPDVGGAADHAADGAGLTYRATDPQAAAAAIVELLSSPGEYGFRGQPRTIFDHFDALFRDYAELRADFTRRIAPTEFRAAS